MESSKETYSKLYNVKGGQMVSLDDIVLEFRFDYSGAGITL
jgi:hypothetical protein